MRTIQRISLAVAILGLVLLTGENQADNPPAQDSGVDVLTRGPVHEAYASAVPCSRSPGRSRQKRRRRRSKNCRRIRNLKATTCSGSPAIGRGTMSGPISFG